MIKLVESMIIRYRKQEGAPITRFIATFIIPWNISVATKDLTGIRSDDDDSLVYFVDFCVNVGCSEAMLRSPVNRIN